MREGLTSKCEQLFVSNAATQHQRVDGRASNQSRDISIAFGSDRGCCIVNLGNTKVLAQVSCEVVPPTEVRPTEGILHINVEYTTATLPNLDMARSSEMGVELTRLLETCIRDSHCIDLESLCIVAGDKVWCISVDIHVLNNDGNLVECASIATVAGLAHFRRPAVTVSGTDITVCSVEDHDPVPLNLHHMPLCITFVFFEEGKYILADPTELEEKVAQGRVVVGMNSHDEICGLLTRGSLAVPQVLQCTRLAAVQAKEITDLLKEALNKDTMDRTSGHPVGFATTIQVDRIVGARKISEIVNLQNVKEEPRTLLETEPISSEMAGTVKAFLEEVNITRIGEGAATTWGSWNVESDEELEIPLQQPEQPSPEMADESEEEVVTLQPEDVDVANWSTKEVEEEEQNEVRGWYPKNPF